MFTISLVCLNSPSLTKILFVDNFLNLRRKFSFLNLDSNSKLYELKYPLINLLTNLLATGIKLKAFLLYT